MQKISTLFLFIILFCTNAIGQAPTVEWAKTYGNSNEDNLQSIKSDEFGNVYYAGNFYDSLDLDPGPGIQKMYGNYNTLYLVILRDSKFRDSLSPLAFEKDNIKNLIINQRKLALINQMEKEVFKEAQKNNELEIYDK